MGCYDQRKHPQNINYCPGAVEQLSERTNERKNGKKIEVGESVSYQFVLIGLASRVWP